MRLWQVSVADVSQRFVWAKSAKEAVAEVRADISARLDLDAHAASPGLDVAYREAGPIQRKRLIASLDGLNPPAAARNTARTLRRLREYEDDRCDWIAEQLDNAPKPPPVNPRTARRLAMLAEQDYVTAIRRMRDRADETSPLHTDNLDL